MPPVLIRYLAVAVLARLADDGSRVAFVLLGLAVTGDALLGGLLIGAFLVPHVLAAPIVGALADRARHRRPLYTSFLLLYGGAIAGCAVLAGRVPSAIVLLVAAAGGCFAPLVIGGLSSLLRDLVPVERRDRAYGMDVMTYNVAGICGPAAVAFLVAGLGARPATLAVAGAALAAALLAATLPLPERPPQPGITGAVSRIGFAVVGVMWRERTLRAVTVATGLGAMSIGALPVVSALLAAEYGTGYAAGALLSATAGGGLLGSLLYARFPLGAKRPQYAIMVCLLASAVPLALVPLSPGVAAALVLFGVSGFFVGPQSAALFAARDRHAPPAMYTQVFTLGAGLKLSFAALGAASGGAAAGLGGGGLVLAVAACYAVAAGIGAAMLRIDRI